MATGTLLLNRINDTVGETKGNFTDGSDDVLVYRGGVDNGTPFAVELEMPVPKGTILLPVEVVLSGSGADVEGSDNAGGGGVHGENVEVEATVEVAEPAELVLEIVLSVDEPELDCQTDAGRKATGGVLLAPASLADGISPSSVSTGTKSIPKLDGLLASGPNVGSGGSSTCPLSMGGRS